MSEPTPAELYGYILPIIKRNKTDAEYLQHLLTTAVVLEQELHKKRNGLPPFDKEGRQ